MGLADRTSPVPRSRVLSWAPPTLTNPVTVTVDNTDPDTRFIRLSAGQDCLIQITSQVTGWLDQLGTRDSLIHVNGGRHVVLIGGWITAGVVPTTTAWAGVAAGDNLILADSRGFPSTGTLRLDGEMISYTGNTGAAFTGCTRNVGFYNTSDVSSNTTHASGSVIYLSESARQGILVEGQTGTVHIEGLLIDGAGLGDGIRINTAGVGSIVQIQNCAIGPVRNTDTVNSTDGHPDCIQIINGPDEVRLDRLTLYSYSGRGILNKGSNTGRVCPSVTVRDVEIVASTTAAPALISNFDTATAWSIANLRITPVEAAIAIDSTLATAPRVMAPGSPVSGYGAGAGLTYVTPGYLS